MVKQRKPGYAGVRPRSGWRKARPKTAFGKANLALKKVNKLKKALNPEKKKFDYVGAAAIGATWTNIYSVTQIAQGDDDHQRTGNLISAQSISGNILVYQNASASLSVLRLVVVHDTQTDPDGNTLNGTDIFEVNGVESLLNRNHLGRYRILSDQTTTLGTARNVAMYKISIPLKNLQVRYNGSADTDIQKNGIYVLGISNEGTNTPTVTHYLRFTYTDI